MKLCWIISLTAPAICMRNRETLLKQELREPAIYNAIIKAIAEGASRMNDIKMKVGEENSVVSKYLKTLIGLGIVKEGNADYRKTG